MIIKHLESKIRLVGIACTTSLVGYIVISVSSIWTARTMVTDAQKKVYVLNGNVPILATRTTMDETLDVRAESHVEMFHHYFFTLAPDDKYIHYTMEKAMYLVGETGLTQYNTLKRKGFYSNILGTSAAFSIFCDSISFDKKNMEFAYRGRQQIERQSNIPMRGLVMAGRLKHVLRTGSNPHGLLMVDWRTLLNKDIERKTKNNYQITKDVNIRGFRWMLFGEKMPNRDGPRYKGRYEREVQAEHKFARTTRIDRAAVKMRSFTSAYRTLFLVVAFIFVAGAFVWDAHCLVAVCRHSPVSRTATEKQDSVFRERHKLLQEAEIREHEDGGNKPQ